MGKTNNINNSNTFLNTEKRFVHLSMVGPLLEYTIANLHNKEVAKRADVLYFLGRD